RLDARELVIGHRLPVREVEAEFFRIDQGALLLNAFTQDFAQGPVREVRGGVVLLGERALRREYERDFVADLELSAADATDVKDVLSDGARHLDDELRGWRSDHATVTDLSTHLGV